jgi:hypothetical protein
MSKGIDWKARYFKLKEAVDDLSHHSVHSLEGYNIPTAETWDRLETVAAHYAQDKVVNILPSVTFEEELEEE